jgi:hypothetical protein
MLVNVSRKVYRRDSVESRGAGDTMWLQTNGFMLGWMPVDARMAHQFHPGFI